MGQDVLIRLGAWGEGKGILDKRGGEEEGRRGHGRAGKLSWEKNRGEQDERYHNRGSHYKFEERSGTSEMSRDLQG